MKINKEYKELTDSIINNQDFKLLRNDVHHGTNKYEHCKRVAYLSFLMAKIFKGNTKNITIAGLLHDFFFGERTTKDENSYLRHPMTSAKNAIEYFHINKEEAEIIENHMYHYAIVKKLTPFINEEDKNYLKNHKPKNKESIIVCVSDLLVSIYEVGVYKIKYSAYLYSLFFINWIRL